MNFELLKKYFQVEATVASTASTLLIPSVLSKEMAAGLVDELSVEPVLKNIAIALAKVVGDHLTVSALRPADFQDLRELPDSLIERIIEELAKKPETFFQAFRDALKNQG
jgi:hypothetical protein